LSVSFLSCYPPGSYVESGSYWYHEYELGLHKLGMHVRKVGVLVTQLAIDTSDWRIAALYDLLGRQNPDGGWSYLADQSSTTEPTALALMAAAKFEPEAEGLSAAQEWLISHQREDGHFAASSAHTDAGWLTSLAALSLHQRGKMSSADHASQALLSEPVLTFVSLLPGVYGYSTVIPGWPWTSGDFSFVEPTAMAIIFLKQVGQGDAPRVRQGVQLLHDRFIAGAGWNYGEPTVLGGELFPTAMPTALAILALADEQNEMTDVASNWLLSQRGRLTSLLSLGWVTVALNVYGLLDDDWRNDVMTLWQQLPEQRRGPMETSLCLLGLADGEDHPFGLIESLRVCGADGKKCD